MGSTYVSPFGGGGFVPAMPLPGPFTGDPSACQCADADCSEIIVTTPPRNRPFYAKGGRFIVSPFYRQAEPFLCVGGSVFVAGGACRGGGDSYVYGGFAAVTGPEFVLGAAPDGAEAYLAGESTSLIPMTMVGVGGSPDLNSPNRALLIGTPGLSHTWGYSVTDIRDTLISRINSNISELARGFYDEAGRPYGP